MNRTALVPDLDGEAELILDAYEELFMSLNDVIADERGHDPDWRIDGLDLGLDEPTYAIRRAIAAGRQRPGRVLAPDGRYEHLPVHSIDLDSDDVDRFGAAVAAIGIGYAALDTIVAELVDAHAHALPDAYARTRDLSPGRALVDAGARLHGLLTLDVDQALVNVLGDGSADVVLDPASEAAYQAYATRAVAMFNGGSALDRYLY
jgi:hypothetical protein